MLHAFASGGAAVTGVEAISNGVPAFKRAGVEERPHDARDHGLAARRDVPRPVDARRQDARRARTRRARRRSSPRSASSSTATAPLGHVLFYALQAGTMLILVLAANTSFADFPRLASFHAGDNFMPRQLTKRGHRLVFSNGIIVLAVRGDRAADRHRRQGRPPDPALRHRRVHQLHAVAGRHGQAPHHATRSRAGGTGLFVNGIGARPVVRRRRRSSPSPSSRTARG